MYFVRYCFDDDIMFPTFDKTVCQGKFRVE